MYFIIPIDLQCKTIFDFCGYYNESLGIDLSGRAPQKLQIPYQLQYGVRLKLATGILVIYNLIDDVAHAGNKDWGGGLTSHMWTCGITFLAVVCQLTGYLVSVELKLQLKNVSLHFGGINNSNIQLERNKAEHLTPSFPPPYQHPLGVPLKETIELKPVTFPTTELKVSYTNFT